MSYNKHIFNMALKKAKANGFYFPGGPHILLEEPPVEGFEILKYKKVVRVQVDAMFATYFGLEGIIFSHDFAKAFWGEEVIFNISSKVINLYSWQYHLQRMVLEEEPLKYLEKFL